MTFLNASGGPAVRYMYVRQGSPAANSTDSHVHACKVPQKTAGRSASATRFTGTERAGRPGVRVVTDPGRGRQPGCSWGAWLVPRASERAAGQVVRISSASPMAGSSERLVIRNAAAPPAGPSGGWRGRAGGVRRGRSRRPAPPGPGADPARHRRTAEHDGHGQVEAADVAHQVLAEGPPTKAVGTRIVDPAGQ